MGNYMRWRLLVTILLFLLAGTTLRPTYANEAAPLPAPVMAQDRPNEACIPVDLVLVIDQSSSNNTTDPNSLRVDVARFVVDQMFVHAGLNCKGIVTHRLAIIGFNDAVELLLDPIEIYVPDTGVAVSNDEWLTRGQEIQNGLRSTPNGQTNYANVLLLDPNSAVNMLTDQMPPIGGDAEIRKKFMIIITDGLPCTNAEAAGADGGVNYCRSVLWMEHYFYDNADAQYPAPPPAYFLDLEDGLIAALNAEVPTSVRIDVVSFSAPDARVPAVSRAWDEIATSRSGDYVELDLDEGYAQVTAATKRILDEILITNSTPARCNQPVLIEPYSSTTIVSAIRPNRGSNITVIQPNGDPITPEVANSNSDRISYTIFETVEQYFIADPMPGNWLITSDDQALCDQIDAFFENVPFEANIAIPDPETVIVQRDAPYYQPDSQAFVQVQVNDKRFQQPLIQRDEYPLIVCGTVTGPIDRRNDGIEPATYPDSGCIDFRYLQPGLWEATAPLPAPYQGTYQLEIDIKTDSFDRNDTIDLYNSGPLPYTTALPVAVELQLQAPVATQSGEPFIWALNEFDPDTSLQSPNSLPVRVQLKDGNGNPVPASAAFRGLENEAIEAVLEGPVNETISLTVDPNDPSMFVGVLRDNVTDLDPAGDYVLTVNVTDDAQSNFNRENYVSTFSAPSQTIEGIELVGVVLEITGWQDEILYNTITNGQRQNVKIPIEVRLLDQSGDELTASEVFGSAVSPDSLVQAQLIGPNNATVGSAVFLRYDSTINRFTGDLLDQVSPIGQPGDHVVSVRFADSAILSDNQAREYTLVTTANRAITDTISRIERNAVSVELVEVSVNGLIVPDGDTAPLNTVLADANGEYEQEELPIAVQARLVDLDGNTYLSLDGLFVAGTDIDNIMTVTANGPGGAADTALLTFDPQTGLWTGRLFTNPRRGAINQGGSYTFTITLVESAFSTDRLASHELLVESMSYAMVREEQTGVKLRLMRLGEREEGFDPQPIVAGQQLKSVETIPLHNTTNEAMGFILWPNDDDPRAVPFQFTIEDTNGESQDWQALIEDTTLTIDQVVSISVVSADGSETIPITNLRAERIAGDYVISGAIDNEATSSGTYRLIYGLQSTTPQGNRFKADITNLSQNQQQVAFSREEVSITENPTLNPLFWDIIAGLIWLVLFGLGFHILRLNVPFFPIPPLNAFMSGKMEVSYLRGGQQTPTTVSLRVPFRFFGASTKEVYKVTPPNNPSGTATVKVVVKRAGWMKKQGSSRRPFMGDPHATNAVPDKRLRRYAVKITVTDTKNKSNFTSLYVYEGLDENSPQFTVKHYKR